MRATSVARRKLSDRWLLRTAEMGRMSTQVARCRPGQASGACSLRGALRACVLGLHTKKPLRLQGFLRKWSGGGSNSRPRHCERRALPTELPPRSILPKGPCRPRGVGSVARRGWIAKRSGARGWHRLAKRDFEGGSDAHASTSGSESREPDGGEGAILLRIDSQIVPIEAGPGLLHDE